MTAIPGVESAALATRVPLQVNPNRWEIWIPGRHQPGEHGDTIEVTTVSTGYFKTIGVADRRGPRVHRRRSSRHAARRDRQRDVRAAATGRGQSAIGKTFRTRGSEGPLFEIVGVSADHKVLTLSERPTPFLQIPRSQRPGSYAAIIARTRGDAAALLRDMRRELLALEPNLVFVENQTMEAEVDATLFPMRASAWLVSGVGLVAMLLAAIGLYGVIALLGGAPHARDRHPRGARRAARRGRRAGDAAGAAGRGRRACRRLRCSPLVAGRGAIAGVLYRRQRQPIRCRGWRPRPCCSSRRRSPTWSPPGARPTSIRRSAADRIGPGT